MSPFGTVFGTDTRGNSKVSPESGGNTVILGGSDGIGLKNGERIEYWDIRHGESPYIDFARSYREVLKEGSPKFPTHDELYQVDGRTVEAGYFQRSFFQRTQYKERKWLPVRTALAKGRDDLTWYMYAYFMSRFLFQKRLKTDAKVDRGRLLRGERYYGGIAALGGTTEEVGNLFERFTVEFLWPERVRGRIYALGPAVDVDENSNLIFFGDDVGVWEEIVPGFNRLEVYRQNGERIV